MGYNQKKVLISGANGYIALHIARFLKEKKYSIITGGRYDDFDINMDFSKPQKIISLKIEGVDTMIHTVSPNESLYRTDPYRALAEHAAGISSALDFCVNNKIKNFIYFSSFHVFGKQEGTLTEKTVPQPTNYYGLTHSIAEKTIQMFDQSESVNGWIIRPSNLFGIPENIEKFKRWNLIPFLFCYEAIENQGIILKTSGLQSRNFVGINDVCQILFWILEQRPQERIFHAHGNDTMSVYEYALLVQKKCVEKFNIEVLISRPETEDQIQEFDFRSINVNTGLQPKSYITDFTDQMLEHLLVSSKSRKEE